MVGDNYLLILTITHYEGICMRNIEVDKNINVGIISVFGELYSPAEIAELFKVAQSTIYNWIKTGKLEGHILSHGKRKTTVR